MFVFLWYNVDYSVMGLVSKTMNVEFIISLLLKFDSSTNSNQSEKGRCLKDVQKKYRDLNATWLTRVLPSLAPVACFSRASHPLSLHRFTVRPFRASHCLYVFPRFQHLWRFPALRARGTLNTRLRPTGIPIWKMAQKLGLTLLHV